MTSNKKLIYNGMISRKQKSENMHVWQIIIILNSQSSDVGI